MNILNGISWLKNNKIEKFKEVITALKEIVTDQFINKCEHCRKRLNKNECVERSVLVYYARVRREKYFCNSKHADIYEKKVKNYWGTDKLAGCNG